MSPILVLAALAGQLPTPQQPSPPAAAGPPQTLLLLQYAPPPTATTPSVLVSAPPIWDRIMARTGRYLVERAARHQHAAAAQLVTLAPAAAVHAPRPVLVQLQPATMPAAATAPHSLAPLPSASAQSEAVPPPPVVPAVVQPAAEPLLLVPDATRTDAIRRLFGPR